jgi:hypothetical protein
MTFDEAAHGAPIGAAPAKQALGAFASDPKIPVAGGQKLDQPRLAPAWR